MPIPVSQPAPLHTPAKGCPNLKPESLLYLPIRYVGLLNNNGAASATSALHPLKFSGSPPGHPGRYSQPMRRRPTVSALATLAILLSPLLATGQRKPASQQSSDTAEATRLFRAGSEAFTAGDLPTAHADFGKLVKLAPQISAAHAAFGAVLLAEKDLPHAAAELTAAHKLDPTDPLSTLNLAVTQSRLGDNAAAVALFRGLTPEALDHLQSEESLAYARALAGTGDLTGAQTVLHRALGQQPQPGPALFDALGSLEAQQRQYDAAQADFTQGLQIKPDYAPAHAHLGSLFLLTGHAPEALNELRRAQALGDASFITQVELGRALGANGQDTEAVTALRQALKAQPNSLDAQYALALALQSAGQSEEALPLFTKVSAARPQDAATLINYGLALVQTGDAKSALVQYIRASTLDPENSTLHEDMGVAYLQTNDIDHAIEQFHAGLQLDPDNPQLHYDLGLGFKLKDDLTHAIPELERAEALDPKLPDPPYTLGVIRMQQGNAAEAVHQLQGAVALRPTNADAWALLGSEHKETGNLDAAADALHHAIALAPDQPSPHVTLAAILSTQGNREAAAAERKTAADLSRKAMSHQRAGFALQSGRALLAQGDLPGAVLQLKDALTAEPNLKEAHLLLAQALQKQGRATEALAERQKAEALASPVTKP